MLIALWAVTAVSCLTAILLWRRMRRMSSQLDQLSHRYWELKYEHQELRAQLARAAGPEPGSAPAPPPRPARSGEAFVPLASLRR